MATPIGRWRMKIGFRGVYVRALLDELRRQA